MRFVILLLNLNIYIYIGMQEYWFWITICHVCKFSLYGARYSVDFVACWSNLQIIAGDIVKPACIVSYIWLIIFSIMAGSIAKMFKRKKRRTQEFDEINEQLTQQHYARQEKDVRKEYIIINFDSNLFTVDQATWYWMYTEWDFEIPRCWAQQFCYSTHLLRGLTKNQLYTDFKRLLYLFFEFPAEKIHIWRPSGCLYNNLTSKHFQTSEKQKLIIPILKTGFVFVNLKYPKLPNRCNVRW